MNLNQLSIIGFVGKNAETKYLPNGTPVTKFSVATRRSWKDENERWQEKTQWHNVGKGFAQLARTAFSRMRVRPASAESEIQT